MTTATDRFVSVHVTDLCNEKCSFCVVGSPFFQVSEVRDDDIWEFLRRFAGRGYGAVNLHGGEPTVYPRLLELLDEIVRLGYPEIHLQTNARRLRDPRLVAQLRDRRTTLAIVSLHGGTADVHDRLTSTPGGFEQTVAGIRNAREAGIAVRTNLVLTTENLDDVDRYAELVVELGVDHVNVSNLHPVGSGYFSFARLAPDLGRVAEPLRRLASLLRQARVPTTLEGFPYCSVGELAELQLESRARDVPLLWKGRVIDSYDEFMDEGRRHGPMCSGCGKRPVCGGVYREYVELRGWSGVGAV